MSSKRWSPMPPQRRQREYESAVDPDALHIDEGRVTGFGEPKEVLKKSEADALRSKAAEAERFKQLAEQLQRQGATGLAVQGDAIMVHGFQLTPNGLLAPQDVDRETWEQVGSLLHRLEGSIQWLIGDWLVYGENLAYGELQARVEAAGHNYQTIRNYMVVCRAFELYRRRYNLSFGHYHAAASLPEDQQDQALTYAQENNLSVAAFRKLVRQAIDGQAETPALPASNLPVLKPLMTEFKKLMQRDPVQAEEYVSQIERTAAEMRVQLQREQK